jgi:hypothetical protein
MNNNMRNKVKFIFMLLLIASATTLVNAQPGGGGGGQGQGGPFCWHRQRCGAHRWRCYSAGHWCSGLWTFKVEGNCHTTLVL